ncbi:MAG: type II toxin-antitoxin system HipA family toxin [Gallionellaceae bacterium]|nr:type II toxin-antitoxin system HipA family toxin [Gallionellaceae bacterium]
MASTLRVFLHNAPVGLLSLDQRDGSDFRLLESYKQAYPRPVLGQAFLDDLDQVQHTRNRVPPWFSNLLPEGPLRELVAKQAGVHASREFFLLRHLGEDLPGAVRIVADAASDGPDETDQLDGEPADKEAADAWHFSLAGVQLKFSARQSERGLTVPVSGRGGDWIVKLPDIRYPKVPENEYATMLWARESGIRVPQVELVDIATITGLPATYRAFTEQYALAIRRFDRPSTEERVHMEDFAQILGLYPDEKYEKYNYETLARLILALTEERGLDEFIRRLVFIIVSGNGDAHHKNWSLLYPDGVQAELSPAYDLVSTIQYQPEDKLALNLGGSKRWEDVSMDVFRRLARKIGDDEARVANRVAAALDAILGAWQAARGDFGFTAQARERMEAHFSHIPLLRGH